MESNLGISKLVPRTKNSKLMLDFTKKITYNELNLRRKGK
jgi:hypothetical protein